MLDTIQGVVLEYNRQKGWGFIRPDDPNLPDFFTCYKFIEADQKWSRFVRVGQRVEFQPVDIDTRPQAHHVRLVRPVTVVRQTGGQS
jgi:cold shock CspA family protein